MATRADGTWFALRERAEYIKLTDGSWGIRIRAQVKPDYTISAQTRAGKVNDVVVGEIVQQTPDFTVARIKR